MVRKCGCKVLIAAESVTIALGVNVAAVLGVSFMERVGAGKTTELGRLPDTKLDAYGGVSPLADNWELYGDPSTPFGRAAAVINKAAATTEMDKFDIVELPFASWTPNVTAEVPEAKGMPDVSPSPRIPR